MSHHQDKDQLPSSSSAPSQRSADTRSRLGIEGTFVLDGNVWRPLQEGESKQTEWEPGKEPPTTRLTEDGLLRPTAKQYLRWAELISQGWTAEQAILCPPCAVSRLQGNQWVSCAAQEGADGSESQCTACSGLSAHGQAPTTPCNFDQVLSDRIEYAMMVEDQEQ